MTHMVLTAAAATLAAGIVGAVVVWLLRGRSLVLTTTLTVLTAVLAAVIGVITAGHQMFISSHDVAVLISIGITAAVIGSGASLIVGLRATAVIQQQSEAASLHEAELAIEGSRRQLVAWMSHDLRSPLAGIRAMIEAIEDGVVDDAETIGQYHRAIRVETQRLAEMVDDLFTLARLHDGGPLTLNKQRVTLADIVAQTVPTAAPLARARQIELCGDGPEIPLDVDVNKVTRVVGNLLNNAIRHTPDGSTVLIDGGLDGDGAYVTVEDECGGIPAEDLPRVFDVAFRGTAARTPTDDGGAGLGLAIAQNIVDAHGGRIEVHNVARGCRFTAHFPAATTDALADRG